MMCRAYDWTDRLAPGPGVDLDGQERLTRRLLVSRPGYDGTAVRNWPGAVEDALGVPVVLTSHGPTAEDKRERRLRKDRSGSSVGSGSISKRSSPATVTAAVAVGAWWADRIATSTAEPTAYPRRATSSGTPPPSEA